MLSLKDVRFEIPPIPSCAISVWIYNRAKWNFIRSLSDNGKTTVLRLISGLETRQIGRNQ